MLDLSTFGRALNSYDRAIQFSKERLDDDISETEENVIKAGVIQNFEFTYELCWKFMKRWLELNLTPGLLDGVSRKELFRHALENKLIISFDDWVKYHELRKTTSHTYNEDVADEIYAVSDFFLNDAKILYHAIEAKND